jgi:pyridoxal phosphate enzyme (YggS family)
MLKTVVEQTGLAARFRQVQERVRLAVRAAGRAAEDVTLIAVSKTHPVGVLRAALAAGVAEFGENRVQEAAEKRAELFDEAKRNSARWHLIGNLQANKARRAVQTFDVIHTLDSVALAQRLERICGEEGRETLPVLIQVELGGEATKAGVAESELGQIVEAVRAASHLELVGLMTIPPYFEDAEAVRPYFRRLRELRDELRARESFGGSRGELSMGMSHDFEIAIAEGATMVRVGTAIFGARPARTDSLT